MQELQPSVGQESSESSLCWGPWPRRCFPMPFLLMRWNSPIASLAVIIVCLPYCQHWIFNGGSVSLSVACSEILVSLLDSPLQILPVSLLLVSWAWQTTGPIYTHRRTDRNTERHRHRVTESQRHRDAETQRHRDTHTHTHTCARAHTPAHAHTHLCTHTHTHTHPRTRARTHTHTPQTGEQSTRTPAVSYSQNVPGRHCAAPTIEFWCGIVTRRDWEPTRKSLTLVKQAPRACQRLRLTRGPGWVAAPPLRGDALGEKSTDMIQEDGSGSLMQT